MLQTWLTKAKQLLGLDHTSVHLSMLPDQTCCKNPSAVNLTFALGVREFCSYHFLPFE